MKSFVEAIAVLRYCARCDAVRHGMYIMLAAAISCLALILGWWGPAKLEHTQLLRNIDARRSAMVEAVRSDQVARARRDALPALAIFEKKLDVRTGQADFIQGLARVASRRGVRVMSQSFDEGKVQRTDAPLYLELGLLGSYASLRGIMSDLATLPMWIEVVEARFERADEGSALVRAQLRLLTYREMKGRQ